jgi:hypothetical protein
MKLTAHIEEQLVTEEIMLEQDIETMIKQIRFIQNKHGKLGYIRFARRVIGMMLEKRLPGQMNSMS